MAIEYGDKEEASYNLAFLYQTMGKPELMEAYLATESGKNNSAEVLYNLAIII